MSETLVLRLPETGRPAAWMVVDAAGNRLGELQTGELADAGPFAGNRRVRVCVPAAEVALLHADIPTRSTGKLLQAIPFAVEDQLAEDIETLHFALGQHTARGYLVAAVARARMQGWLQELAAAGIAPAELVPDVLTLPVRAQTLVLVPDGDRTLARFPDGIGIVAGDSLLPLLIRQQLEHSQGSDRCATALIYAVDGQAPPSLESMAESLDLEIVHHTLHSGALGLMGATRLPAQAINLLQGEFGRNTGPREYWRRWRIAAALLAGLIVVLIAQQIVSEIRLRNQVTQLHAEVAGLFHQALPDVTRMVDPQAQMQQRLNGLTGGADGSTGLLSLLTAAGKGLQAQPDVQLQGLSFHNGVLQLQVQTSNLGALDTLKAALQRTAALHANLDSVSSNSGQTTARLTLSGAGL